MSRTRVWTPNSPASMNSMKWISKRANPILRGTSLFDPIIDRILARVSEPRLELESKVDTTTQPTPDDDRDLELTTTIFRVPVSNVGRVPAENCRASLDVVGVMNPPSWLDGSSNAQDTPGPQFNVKTGLCWSDPGKPATRTIDGRELAHFDLVMVQHLHRPFDPTQKIHESVKFPTETGWGGSSPVQIITRVLGDGSARPAEGDHRIYRDQLVHADYSKAKVTVTAENAEPVSAVLRFTEERGRPHVAIDRRRNSQTGESAAGGVEGRA